MEIDDLLPVAETLDLLGFAVLAEGDIALTSIGKSFVEHDTRNAAKSLFATQQLAQCVPLAGHIKRVLDDRPNPSRATPALRDRAGRLPERGRSRCKRWIRRDALGALCRAVFL